MPPRKKAEPSATTSSASVAEPSKTTTPSTAQAKDVHKLPDFSSRQAWSFELISQKPAILKLGNNNLRAYNPETDRFEGIRFCVNEDSIWIAEQSEKVQKGFVVFTDGLLEVPYNETAKLEFLFRHPEFNKSFRLVDKERDASVFVKQAELEIEALLKAKTAPFSQISLIALAKGYPDDNETVCRKAMYEYAKRSPKDFLDSFDNQLIKVSAKIRKAVNKGVIQQSGNYLRWADTGNKIMVIPSGADMIAYASGILVDNTNEQNAATLEAIEKAIS